MNKITFPLSMGTKHDAVADLHAALNFLKLDVAKEETQEQYYGKETDTAVLRFQAENRVRETGKVDEETAHELNQLLHEAGKLGDFDSYAIRGRISNTSKSPLSGLLIRAVDIDPSGENPLGQPVVTDEEGLYTIIYYDHQFRIGGRESGNADVVVRVFDPDSPENPLKQSKLQRNVQRNITLDLAVDYKPSRQPLDGDYDKFVVKGWVRSPDGTPAPDIRVTAYDVRLRQESPLGEDHTRQDGRYEIVYTRKQFADVEKSAADLRIRAYDSKGGELAFSDIVYGAGEVKTINLTLDNAAYRGPSEYEQLVTLLEPRLRGLRFSELGEDDKHQDVSFISGNTGADPRQVALLIAANRLSVRTAIPAELYYGLFRNDLSVDLPSLLIQDPDVLRRALEQAVTDNIIPDRFGDEVDKLPDRFKELVVEEAIRPSASGEPNSPLVALLGTTLSNSKHREHFLQRYVAHSGPVETFWDDLRASPEFRDKVDDLQFTLQAGALGGGHLQLVEVLLDLRSDPDAKISTVRDLARFDEADWRRILDRAHGQGSVGVPPDMPGEDESAKRDHYARMLARRSEFKEPTAVFAARLRDDDLAGKDQLLTFFEHNRDGFDITRSRLESYLQETPNALDGIAESDRPLLKQQLQVLQRLYRIAPEYTAASTLYKSGITSAADIVRMGSTQFSLKHGQVLGEESRLANARRVYTRAEAVHAWSLALVSSYGSTSSSVSMKALPEESLPPDWTTLFGSLELCECDHCRSIYSPAAYFVDVLHFLQDRSLIAPATIVRNPFGQIESVVFSGMNARDILFERRGDLGEIELSCDNTNTLMPYVDLVNEVLENYVAPPPLFEPFDLDPAANPDPVLVSDLNDYNVSDRLRAAFTEPPLSEFATIEVQKAGERWRIHDQSFTYTLRMGENGSPEVTTRSRQTRGSAQELAANPQYLNSDAYEKLAESVFPLSLPFDLGQAQARPYLEHLGVQSGQLMETFLPGDRAALLENPAIGREWLNLTTTEADLITGVTTEQSGATEPGIWNLWGFAEPTLDSDSAIPNPKPHRTGDVQDDTVPDNSTAWINSGDWLDVLTDRVDVFLQQSGLTYKQMLTLLGGYFINPSPDSRDDPRPITIRAHDGQPEDTCETQHLRIDGMDENAALRSLRFIRLWRKMDWSMQDLDRALDVLKVSAIHPVTGATTDSFDASVVTRLGIIQRLHDVLRLPVQRLLPFWGNIDSARYIDHDAAGQPDQKTLYQRLFRNKSVLNPPDRIFTEDPSGLSGPLSDHTAAISSALGISSTEFGLLLQDDAGVLSLENLSKLYRHATLAKALRLSIRDYLTALKLHGNPFATPAATLLFVESIDAVRSGGVALSELDYLSSHRIIEKERVAPTDEEVTRILTELRAELQQIASENTFEQDPDAPNGPTVDPQGDLTAAKLALLGWSDELIDEVVATLNGSVTYRTALASLPLPDSVSLPADMPQLTYDVAAAQLQFTGVMTVEQRGDLAVIVAGAAFRDAVTQLFNAPRHFVQRNMRGYSIEHFETPLTTLPDITFPVALEERIYHDVEAEKLYFVGAMSEDERDALLGLSSDNGFQTAIETLFAAPDSQPSTDPFLTHEGADSDTDALFLNPETKPAERFSHVLSKLMPHLLYLLSERAVTQRLADTLGLEARTAHHLLTQWLDSTGQEGGKLLAAFLEQDFVDSNANIPITRGAFSDQFDAYLRLQKIALIVERLECTPLQVGWPFSYASAAGWPDLTALPLTEQPTPAESLEAWLRLIELFSLRDRLPRGEEMLDELLSKAAAVGASASDADKNAAKKAYMEALAQWTEWSGSDLEVFLGADDDHTKTGLLEVGFPDDYAGVRLLRRLNDCFALLKRLGMSAAQCSDLVTVDVTSSTAEMIKQAVRAKYDEAQWLELAKPLRDTLREQQRAALVAYLLTIPPDDPLHGWRDSNDIYNYFLIDVEMDPCMMTSRIKQAISSVQLFVQRCLMNLEPEVLASAEIDDKWREWSWMKNYRVWEANRKIFLYPENWIEPELRDDKTPFFQELESELLQSDLTHDSAETAFRGYLNKLDAVARLEMVGMYHEKEEDAATGQLAVDVLHVFGRTAGIPHVYYYRRRINDNYWTAWERVDLDIEGDHLIPVVWRGRLYLIWPIFTERKIDSELAESNNVAERYWEIHLARSEYKGSKWMPKKISEEDVRGFTFREDKSSLVFKGTSDKDLLDIHFSDTVRLSFSASTIADSIIPISNGMSVNVIAGRDSGRTPISASERRAAHSELATVIASDNFVVDSSKPRPVIGFRMSGCNSGFVVIREVPPAVPTRPQGLEPYSMSLREDSNDHALYLPKTTSTSGKALQKTPGNPFRILYAHQLDGFSSLYKSPWFFNDDTRTYFVTPHFRVGVERGSEELIKVEDAVNALSSAPSPQDPFDPNLRDDRFGRVILPGDPLRFAETTPVTDFTSLPSGNLALAAASARSNVLRSVTSPALRVAREHLETVNRRTVSRLKSFGSYRYTFHSFYHPYLCKLIEALNRNGVDALFQRPLQLRSDSGENTFKESYVPITGLVSSNYPLEEIDFSYYGAYSQYNWELFFHAPLLIANSLRQNQRFADAHRWFHYIFDPTDTSGLAAPERYWQTKPFHIKTGEDYQQRIGVLIRLLASAGDLDRLPEAQSMSDAQKSALLDEYEDLTIAVAAWRSKPFNPHLVARMRTTAYQKSVVMKYIDNLIAWGDQLFRRDTIESINEATQLYIMAADILGKRPKETPPRAVPEVHTYNTIEPLLGDASNALALIEEFVPPAFAVEAANSDAALPSLPTMLYFCVPKNDNLLAYWDTVADRLFKIRHCMNIEGVERQLALFAPPIDPALLVRATAAGLDIGSVLNEVSAPLPHYRFNVLAQKATELCGELKSLSGALLATLEKRDAEKLALLRAEHESTLLKLVEQVREQQLEEADQQLTVLRVSREIAVGRYLHYQKLLGAQDTQVPAEGEVIPEQEVSANVDIKEEGGVKMIKREKKELAELEDGLFWQRLAAGADTFSGWAHANPDLSIDNFWGGITMGGSHVGSALGGFAAGFRGLANEDSYKASRASRMAQHIMREYDWVLQSNSAAKEIMSTDQQIIGADLRKAIADQELKNHRKQIEQAQKVEQTMRDKYTNQELYNWMIGQISTVYFQSYQLAYDVSKRAERAFRHELALQDASFVQFGYWDSLRKGLLAGDRLHHDIKRMEVAYLNQNKREFEITKQVSLNQLDPAALIQLRQTGECLMMIPEILFDLDYPGHYLRRIKSVSMTIPAVTGPYTGVPCTLSLIRSSVRRSSNLLSEKYVRDTLNDDPRFSDSVGAIQSIVTSSAQNDSGLFETNLRDERFLPFEGAGAISTWRIELPDPKTAPPFDYETISDVVLHIRYTARPAGGLLKQQAISETEDAINAIAKAGQEQGLARLFSVRHEFGSEWHRFLHPSSAADNQTLTLPLNKERFPFLFQGKEITINKIEFYVKVKPDFTETHDDGSLKFTLAEGDLAPDFSNAQPNDVLSLASWNGLLRGKKALPGETGNWTINAWLNAGERLNEKALEDVVIVCHYSVSSP